jgi:acetylornithine deacetylase/succinyl-diaminopimelate desuccinylase-like protein
MAIDWGNVRAEAVEILRDLVRFDTSNPPGNERPAAQYLADKLRAVGLEPKLLESAPGRANVIARLKGNGAAPPLLLSAHLDVVPAGDPASWTHPPFAAEVADGYVWGRGTADMKYGAAQALAVLTLLKQQQVPLKRDVIFAGVADEEQGGRLGSGYLVDNHRHLIQAEFCLSEVGGMVMPVGSGRVALVGTATKGFEWLKVRMRGKSGHGSRPNPESAFARLIHGLHRVESGRVSYDLCGATNAFLSGMGAAQGSMASFVMSLLKSAYLAPLALQLIPEERRGVIEAALYNTAVVSALGGGDPATPNVVQAEATAVLDARYLPNMSRERFLLKLEGLLGHEVELESFRGLPPTDFPRRSELMQAIERAVHSRDRNTRVVPFLVQGFTDANHYVRAGLITYGFMPIILNADEPFADLLHSNDERVSVAGFGDGLELLYDVVLELCGAQRRSAPLQAAAPAKSG